METLALLNDPVDQERLAEAERSLDAGEVTSGDDMGRLLAERTQRDIGPARGTTSKSPDRPAAP